MFASIRSSTMDTTIQAQGTNPTNNYINNVQQPHTLRLLKLIRDGTIEHATEAVVQLCSIAASRKNERNNGNIVSSFTPIQLWDLIGRLQEHLLSPIWKTRTNAAMALEGIAKQISPKDQMEFLTMSEIVNKSDEYHLTVEIPKSNSSIQHETLPTNSNSSLLLTIEDIHNTLDTILTEGRLLYGSSDSYYDKLDEVALQRFDQERVVSGKSSFSKHGSTEMDADNDPSDDDFVQRRVLLQRRIMAQRLGLSELCNVVDTRVDINSVLPLDCITSDDILVDISSDVRESKKSKRRKLVDQIKYEKESKRKMKTKHSNHNEDDGKVDSSSSVRLLLVKEIEKRLRYNDQSTNNNNDGDVCASASSSQKTAQTLLASEFIYRMFDPCWHVRHGAMLGIISLLRAWKDTTLAVSLKQSTGSSNDHDLSLSFPSLVSNDEYNTCLNSFNDDGALFGSWPHDILARCICVLILDRFGDFSGSYAEDIIVYNDTNTNKRNDEASDSVVAPVREVAGQLLTLLLTIAPIRIKYEVLDIFQNLLMIETNNNKINTSTTTTTTIHKSIVNVSSCDWEIRHGVLTAIKFLSSFFLALKQRTNKQSDDKDEVLTMVAQQKDDDFLPRSCNNKGLSKIRWIQSLTNLAIDAATVGLSDSSDDVKAVSAQILTHINLGYQKNYQNQGTVTTTTMFIADNVPRPLWKSIYHAKTVSSSIVSLVTLFSILLDNDCLWFWRTTGAFDNDASLSNAATTKTGNKDDSVNTYSNFKTVCTMIETLLDSDLVSVRTVSLRCICSLAHSFTVTLNSTEFGSIVPIWHVLLETYRRFIVRLFDIILLYSLSEERFDNLGTGNGEHQAEASRRLLDNIQLKLLDHTWKRLSEVATIVTQKPDLNIVGAIKSIELLIIQRYFLIHCEKTTRMNTNVSCLVHAAEALSYFVWCCSRTSSSDGTRTINKQIEFALRLFLTSPWFTQCERACLLYRSLSNQFTSCSHLQSITIRYDNNSVDDSSNNNAVVDDDDRPFVLRVNDEALHYIMHDTSLALLCDHCFVQTISNLSDEQDIVANVVQDTIKFFHQTTLRTLTDITAKTSTCTNFVHRTPTITTMRMDSSLAGAMIKMMLPTKITPIVRALMTSFKNESSSSCSRQDQTCLYLKELLLLFHENNQYDNARLKILSTLCDMAVKEIRNVPTNIVAVDSNRKPACTILESLISNLKENETIYDMIPPMWDRLERLLNSSSTTVSNKEDDEDSLYFVQMVCQGFSQQQRGYKSNHRTGTAKTTKTAPTPTAALEQFVTQFAPILVRYGCEHTIVDIRNCVMMALNDMCLLVPQHFLQQALPLIVQYLNPLDRNQHQHHKQPNRRTQHRMFAGTVLQRLVQTAGKFICPYIRTLIPQCLALMTDPDVEFAKTANNLFAVLVQFAPLVQQTSATTTATTTASLPSSSSSQQQTIVEKGNIPLDALQQQAKNDDQDTTTTSTSSFGHTVMDHLIFGHPLPPYQLPTKIQECMKHVQLRSYQMEGITWLRFLQTVHINGALCDSMGLGKTIQALVGISIVHYEEEQYMDTNTTNKFQTQEKDVYRNDPCSLIVCPSTVVGHWINEIKHHFPGISIFRPLCFHGGGSTTKSNRRHVWNEFMNSRYRSSSSCNDDDDDPKTTKTTTTTANIVVVSYSVLRSDIELFEQMEWCYCVLDEGHLLKNPKTATSRCTRRIKARHKLVLTGTPIQNCIYELWATFDFLMPHFLGTSASFIKDYVTPITKSYMSNNSTTATCIMNGINKLKVLHQKVLPFILRREKEHVLPELPSKTIVNVTVPMTSIQQVLYNDLVCSNTKVRDSITKFVEAVVVSSSSSSNTTATTFSGSSTNQTETNPSKPNENSSMMKTIVSNDTLKSMLALRLLCTHPLLVLSPEKLISFQHQQDKRTLDDDDDDERNEMASIMWQSYNVSGKIRGLVQLLREAGLYNSVDEMTAADNDTSLLYTNPDEQYENDNNDEEEMDHFTSLVGSVSADSITPRQHASTSTHNNNNNNSNKCLIFAQFTKSLDIVEELVLKQLMPSVQYLRLDGRVPVHLRNDIAYRFNHDPTIQILLLTTRIGGLGLNLTGANMIIFLELDYNPFVDIQAMDRVHRIGQTKPVTIYRLITEHTIEEAIVQLQQRKVQTSNEIVNTDNSSMFSMGTERLLDIVAIQPQPAHDSSSSSNNNNNNNLTDGHSTSSRFSATGMYDWNEIMEHCSEEYASLSVEHFVQSFL